MAGIESILPVEQKLSSSLEEFALPIADELRETSDASLFGDIIDWSIVDARSEMLLGQLVEVMGYNDDQEKEEMLRGMFFARQILGCVYGTQLRHYKFPDDVADPDGPSDLREPIRQYAQAYLGEHPVVDDFIKSNMPRLVTNSAGYPHSIENAAAFIFLCGEAGLADSYIKDQIDNLHTIEDM